MIGLVSTVSFLAGISTDSCRRIAASAHRRYKVFTIPKKNGRDVRVVAQPAREVKAIQRAICAALNEYLHVHPTATAYVKGSSIIANAGMHKHCKYLTKLDFKSFFPSIDGESIERALRSKIADLSESEIQFVLNACTWRPEGRQVLCIGAPSSPLMSNAVMYDFDQLANIECRNMGVIYTRYSDDISISSEQPDKLSLAENRIREIIQIQSQPRLFFNDSKRVAVGRGTAMRVTGLTLSNEGKVTVGRTRKRGVRAGISRYMRGLVDEEALQKLRGEISFVLSVEPEFRKVLIRTYGISVVRILPPRIASKTGDIK
ncbi:hypothetical protein XarbCFBP8132_16245 [Xanthomonas arboricola]|uniref:retron St85 family RNA-directed DNA polymerase n=1 Tax=Xanthomonas arboricola TaxID=56448 RepID=UPI000CEEEEBE|nr:retron St85 family RNA-directed DNA polymerase [Xanthomonas arboricola]PPT38721.1 hypothetical protein XarbCFBP8132_16245 [Xanthomonas arboricola]